MFAHSVRLASVQIVGSTRRSRRNWSLARVGPRMGVHACQNAFPARGKECNAISILAGWRFVIKSMGIRSQIRDFQLERGKNFPREDLRAFSRLVASRFVPSNMQSGGKSSDVEICSSTGNDAVTRGDTVVLGNDNAALRISV